MCVKVQKQTLRGFTIVELLIVIVVIAILAAISVVAYNGIQDRAADTKRESDIASIEKALRGYEAIHGGVQTTQSYSGNGPGGWNNSRMANWMTFLESDFGKMPIDPANSLNGASDEDGADAKLYKYYCYPPSTTGGWPTSPTARLRYRSDATGNSVYRQFTVQACLTALP